MLPTIRIIQPSSIDIHDVLAHRIRQLQDKGFKVLHDPLTPDTSLPFLAGSPKDRAWTLWNALTETESQAVLCARGGYGAADLLGLLPWHKLKEFPSKWFIGFSDICAIHSAIVHLSGWPTIHGPMPATMLWDIDNQSDVKNLLEIICQTTFKSEILLQPLINTSSKTFLEGNLFGGCLSVLTSLIGTPYMPPARQPTILFWEDTGENPGRLIRHLSQWQLSGYLDNIIGIILANFRDLDSGLSVEKIKLTLAHRLQKPVWSIDEIGHCCPNWPIPLGTKAVIRENILSFSVKL